MKETEFKTHKHTQDEKFYFHPGSIPSAPKPELNASSQDGDLLNKQ